MRWFVIKLAAFALVTVALGTAHQLVSNGVMLRNETAASLQQFDHHPAAAGNVPLWGYGINYQVLCAVEFISFVALGFLVFYRDAVNLFAKKTPKKESVENGR